MRIISIILRERSVKVGHCLLQFSTLITDLLFLKLTEIRNLERGLIWNLRES